MEMQRVREREKRRERKKETDLFGVVGVTCQGLYNCPLILGTSLSVWITEVGSSC